MDAVKGTFAWFKDIVSCEKENKQMKVVLVTLLENEQQWGGSPDVN